MGAHSPEIRTSLAAVRKRRGIRAAALAASVGVSRQTIYAIEAGSYLPNTAVTLKIARALDVAVEELFSLPDAGDGEEPGPVSAVYLGSGARQPGRPVRVARVGGKRIGVAVDSRPYHLPEADAVVTTRGRLRLFAGEDTIGERIVLAGCDPATSLLARMVERNAGIEIVHAPASSRRALDWLRDGRVHIAGSHLEDPRSAEFNLPFIRRRFRNRDMAVVTFARWEEGFVVAPGNPRKVRAVGDLARDDVAFMNREPGSGSRCLLDALMREAGLAPGTVSGFDRIAFGHLAAAHSVVTGQADCCIATRSAAQAFDLDFVPLRTERYDFVLDRKTLAMPAVETFFDVLQTGALRRKLETLAGYDTSDTGSVRA